MMTRKRITELLQSNAPNAALRFHQKTTIRADLPFIPPHQFPLAWKQIQYKEYPRARHIMLPTPTITRTHLFEVIAKRRSRRAFSRHHMTLNQLSSVLYFAAGISSPDPHSPIPVRMYPSAGARYPIELYAMMLTNSSHLMRGIYHYNVKQHALELLCVPIPKKTQLHTLFTDVNNRMIQPGTIVLIMTVVLERSAVKYGFERAYRYSLIESGHLAQNIYLTAQALGLGCCAIGGFNDTEINKLLDIEEQKEHALYLCAVGPLKK